MVDYSHESPSPEPSTESSRESVPHTPIESNLESTPKSILPLSRSEQVWASPAFLKRKNHAITSLDSSYDPFAASLETVEDSAPKRLKFGRASGQWRYVERTPSPKKDIEAVSLREKVGKGPVEEQLSDLVQTTGDGPSISEPGGVRSEQRETPSAQEDIPSTQEAIPSPQEANPSPQAEERPVERDVTASKSSQMSQPSAKTEALEPFQLDNDGITQPPSSPQILPLTSSRLPPVSPLDERKPGSAHFPESTQTMASNEHEEAKIPFVREFKNELSISDQLGSGFDIENSPIPQRRRPSISIDQPSLLLSSSQSQQHAFLKESHGDRDLGLQSHGPNEAQYGPAGDHPLRDNIYFESENDIEQSGVEDSSLHPPPIQGAKSSKVEDPASRISFAANETDSGVLIAPSTLDKAGKVMGKDVHSKEASESLQSVSDNEEPLTLYEDEIDVQAFQANEGGYSDANTKDLGDANDEQMKQAQADLKTSAKRSIEIIEIASDDDEDEDEAEEEYEDESEPGEDDEAVEDGSIDEEEGGKDDVERLDAEAEAMGEEDEGGEDDSHIRVDTNNYRDDTPQSGIDLGGEVDVGLRDELSSGAEDQAREEGKAIEGNQIEVEESSEDKVGENSEEEVGQSHEDEVEQGPDDESNESYGDEVEAERGIENELGDEGSLDSIPAPRAVESNEKYNMEDQGLPIDAFKGDTDEVDHQEATGDAKAETGGLSDVSTNTDDSKQDRGDKPGQDPLHGDAESGSYGSQDDTGRTPPGKAPINEMKVSSAVVDNTEQHLPDNISETSLPDKPNRPLLTPRLSGLEQSFRSTGQETSEDSSTSQGNNDSKKSGGPTQLFTPMATQQAELHLDGSSFESTKSEQGIASRPSSSHQLKASHEVEQGGQHRTANAEVLGYSSEVNDTIEGQKEAIKESLPIMSVKPSDDGGAMDSNERQDMEQSLELIDDSEQIDSSQEAVGDAIPDKQPAKSAAPITLGFRTASSYYPSLPSLSQHYGTSTDVFGIVVAGTKPVKAKVGRRDYHETAYLSDPQSVIDRNAFPSTAAQIFRPYLRSLPAVQPGDAILLRDFKVQSSNKKPSLVSTASSAWAVFRKNEEVQMRGPPVELGPEERGFAKGIQHWWTSLSPDAKAKIEESIPSEKDSQEGRFRHSPSGQNGSKRRHGLRSGKRYPEGSVENSGLHELRDGTKYRDS